MKNIYFFLFVVFYALSSELIAQVPSYVPTSDLLCWWPLNGNAVDLSQNNLNGTCFNTTSTSDRFGNPCSAIACNGTELGGGTTIVSNIDILKYYQIEIFNRWGQLVWYSDQPAEAWYGRYIDSRDVQLGTYTWKIKYIDNKSVTRTIAGHVNVIR